MEILIGLVLMGLTQLIKALTEKFGKTLTTAGVYILLFLGALSYSYMSMKGVFSTEEFATILTVMTSAVGTYEILIKKVKPLLK